MQLSDYSRSNILNHFCRICLFKLASESYPSISDDDLNMLELDLQKSEDCRMLGLFANDQNVLRAYVINQSANIFDAKPVVLIKVLVRFDQKSVHTIQSVIYFEMIINVHVCSSGGNCLADI